jgi:hypothetical protein
MAIKQQRGRGSTAAPERDAHRPPPPWAKEEAPDESGDASADTDERIVERPDGYHWISEDGRQEFGPFETLAEARADMEGSGVEDEAGDEDSELNDLDIGSAADELGGTLDDE